MQIDSIPDVLRSNPTQNIIFVGNNVRARAIAASQPKKTVLFAFSLSAGHRGADHAAFVLPAAFACCKTDGNLENSRATLSCVLRFFQVHMRN